MIQALEWFNRMSLALGRRRIGLRRIAGLCLIVLGVHTAADRIDDLSFAIIDAVDLFFDGTVAWWIEAAAGVGLIRPATAESWIEITARVVDLELKETLSLWLALGVELGIDVLLLDFAWGVRVAKVEPDTRVTVVDEVRESAQELKEAFSELDVERLCVIPILACFALSGALGAGLAMERVSADAIAALAPVWRYAMSVSAGVGLIACALLVWRFLPDLLHGAILRAHERGRARAARHPIDPGAPASKSAELRRLFKRVRRGGFLAAVCLPLAVLSIVGQAGFFELVQRTGSGF